MKGYEMDNLRGALIMVLSMLALPLRTFHQG